MKTFLQIVVITVAAVASVHAKPKAIETGLLNGTPLVQPGGELNVPGVGTIREVPADLISSVRTLDRAGVTVLVLRISTLSLGAARVYLRNVSLDSTAKLYLYGITSGSIITNISGPFEGAGPLHTGEFWTDAVTGSEIIIELQVAGEIPPVLPFELVGIAPADTSEVIAETVSKTDASPEERTSWFRGRALTHAVEEGWAVFENDILLGRANELPAASPKEGKGSREAVAITGQGYRWPGGIIPYTITSTMPNQTRVTNAITHWNTTMAGHIQFVPRTTEVSFINFVPATSSGTCSSYVGRMWYEQPIQVGSSCSTGNIIHEIGHAVGLWHEQTREDRDGFVKILWENIQAGKEYNFHQNIGSGDDIGAYNYGSIMHYPKNAFSKNGLLTIQTIPAGISIGQRSSLNVSDIAAVKMMYPAQAIQPPPASTTTVTIASTPTGMPVSIDGVNQVTPVTVQWVPGSMHTISALNPAPLDGTVNQFARWSDGGAVSHTITTGTAATTYRADYATSYSLIATSAPTIGTVGLTPAVADSLYSPGTSVIVNAAAPTGYCFMSWTGFIAGTPSRTTVSMNRPYTVQANFQAGSVTVPGTVTTPAAGGALTIGVTATSGCSWKAETTSTWVALSGASGTGSGVITLSIAANTSTAPRSSIISIGDQTVTITQANAIAPSKVILSPTSVVGGVTTTLSRVVLSAPAPIGGATAMLSSSNPALASVPASVFVPGGSTETTFPVVTVGVSSIQTAVIAATSGGVSQSATLTVRPVILSKVLLYPPTVTGGLSTNSSRVTFDGPAGPSGIVVNLTSTNDLVASVPAQVTIPPGQTYALFPVTTKNVLSLTTVTLTASFGGFAQTAILTVNPVELKSVLPSPASVTGGVISTSNRVYLNAPAPAGGLIVMLSSSNPSVAAVPASVIVPAGSSYSDKFPIATTSVSVATPVTISASFKGVIKTADVTVQPPL